MPYVIVRPQGTSKGQQGAVTRANAYLAHGAGPEAVQYPTPDEVAASLPARAGGGRRPTRAAGSQYHRTARAKSIFDVASVAGSPLLADELGGFKLRVDEPADVLSAGSSTMHSPVAVDGAGTRQPFPPGDSVRGPGAARPHPKSLQVSQFWKSSSNLGHSRHAATAASPLAPVLVHGVDVQACLFHVGAQKKWFYEDTLAEMQQAALAIIPPEYKSAIEASFPDALRKGHGVLGAMAHVARHKNKIAPMPSPGAKAVVGVHEEATRQHAERKQQVKALARAVKSPDDELSTSLYRPGSSFRGTERPRSGSTPGAEVEWTPEMVVRQLNLRSGAPAKVDESDMSLVRGDTMTFRTFEAAAEDLLAHLTAQQAQELLDVAMEPAGAAANTSTTSLPGAAVPATGHTPTASTPTAGGRAIRSVDGDERLQAMRQELLTRRIEHLKVRERRSRRSIDYALATAVPSLFDTYVTETRHAVWKSEASAWTRLMAEETSAAMRLALRQRQGRHAQMDRDVAELVQQQERDLRADTARRVKETEQESLEAARAVRRALAHTDHHVKTAITQEREARLRELLAYRRANPATYFPEYAEDEIDGEFVPMRIATAEERERQEALMQREHDDAAAKRAAAESAADCPPAIADKPAAAAAAAAA